MKLKYFKYVISLFLFLLFIGPARMQAATNAVITNEQISIHSPHAYPNPFDNEKEVTHIKFDIYAQKSIAAPSLSIIIYDFNGKKVWTKKMDSNPLNPGYNAFKVIWGGDNDMGKRVANGLYYAKIIVESSNTKVKVVKILVK